MDEIKHPKIVQELIENYLPDFRKKYGDDFIKIKNGETPHFIFDNFSEALENYRLTCEKSAWKRACEKQREICCNQVSGCPTNPKLESEIEDDILNAPMPKFETL